MRCMADVLSAIEQATPKWLTDVLRGSGSLTSGQVLSLVVTRVHTEQLHSVSYFFEATFAGDTPPDLPTRFFLKLPRKPDGRDARRPSTGEREVRMYQALAQHEHRLPVIPCYDAVYDAGERRYHLLLADLSATHDQPAWHLAVADSYVTRTVDCLARLHAFWWEHPQLNDGMGELPTKAEVATDIHQLQAQLPGFLDALGDRLSRDDQRVFEALLAGLSRLWEYRTATRGQTIVHGDAHFWNVLYPRDPQSLATCVMDWQTYHIGPGVLDLAYTLVLRHPHRTPANERTLVRRYHEALLRLDVPDYSWETCWNDYRRMAAEQLLFPLRWWAGNLPADFWGSFVDRALTGFRDLGCAEFLV